MVENSNLSNLKWNLISNVTESIISITPSKTLMVDVATDVIYYHPVVHLERTLEDWNLGSWVPFEKSPTYEICSVYPHLIGKSDTKELISISLRGGDYRDPKTQGGHWICSLNGGVRKPRSSLLNNSY
jgi:hypothetical protein